MKKGLFIFISILALGCNNDKTNPLTAKTAISLVTGINFRQNFDDLSLQLGNPNVLVNNKFLIYPNPANETFTIVSQDNVTDVWIVPANPEKIYQDVNFSTLLNTNLYSEQSINSNSNFSLSGQSSNNMSVNIATLAKGYYRVFVKIGGKIYWDNLYKYENQGNNEQQLTLITSFWN